MQTRTFLYVAALPAAWLIAACGNGDAPSENTGATGGPTGAVPALPAGVFESANPAGIANANATTPGSAQGPTSGAGVTNDAAGSPMPSGVTPPTASTPSEAPDPNGEVAGEEMEEPVVAAARAIEEADIIKVSGDRLYALSSYGGLSVVDISDPDDLRLLGRHRTTATPFEMYVRGEHVFVLYNGYGEYTYEEATDYWTYYQTSYVVALDATDAGNISLDQKFEIPGFIADSRLVGDAMYVVAFDDSYCYRCGNTPQTTVMSLNVSQPKQIAKVDELSFEERQDEYSWRRSLSATDERLYIAGPRYGGNAQPEGSIIQVVDITAASGDMQAGDSIEVAGQINSRWQMDEYDGVLRVISQPLWWTSGGAPVVETYEIVSSDELAALGSTPLVLPRPETLQAVRFDGPRGYAITFEQTDPLFTIDLSDPATPTQVGELEMPGWVYHMEPRGDRLIGLGYDQGNPEGALTVSVFDVSTLATPTMLSRVNFGGDWAQFAEDQDRIHKSFQVLDAQKLMLVPFSGWSYDESATECGGADRYVSGVQLVDWNADTLTLRGVAPSKGQARRALFVQERLLTMSDERLEAFDVSDRDEPVSTSEVELAQIVNQVATVGDTVVRVGNDWWSAALEATVSSLSALTRYEAGVKLSLDGIGEYTCTSESYLSEIMSGGNNVYFLYQHYDRSNPSEYKEQLKVRTVDVSDPENPAVAGDAALGIVPNYGNTYVPGMVNNGSARVGVGSSLVFAQHDIEYNNLGFITKSGYTLEVVDFSDAQDPQRVSVAMPDSLGSTGLLVSGDVVATSHFETSPSNPNNVRFFLDRLDVSAPAEPKLLTSVNIPGSLLAYDHEASRALTVDYQYVTLNDISPKQCYEEEFGAFLTSDPSKVDYEQGRGPCSALRYKLHLLDIGEEAAALVASYDVDKGVQVTAAAIGDDRVFVGTSASTGYYASSMGPVSVTPGIAIGSAGIGYYSYGFQTGEAKLLVASGLKGGKLEVAAVTLETTSNFYGFSNLLAKGTQAVVATGWQGRLSVVDASDAAHPVVRDSAELGGAVSDLDLAGNVAIAALGSAGVQTLTLAAE